MLGSFFAEKLLVFTLGDDVHRQRHNVNTIEIEQLTLSYHYQGIHSSGM